MAVLSFEFKVLSFVQPGASEKEQPVELTWESWVEAKILCCQPRHHITICYYYLIH